MASTTSSGSCSAWPAPKSTPQCCVICSCSSAAAQSCALRCGTDRCLLRMSPPAFERRPRPVALLRSVRRQRSVCPPTVILSAMDPPPCGRGRSRTEPLLPFSLQCQILRQRWLCTLSATDGSAPMPSSLCSPRLKLVSNASESPVDECRRSIGGGADGGGAGGGGFACRTTQSWLERFRHSRALLERSLQVRLHVHPRDHAPRFASRYIGDGRRQPERKFRTD